MNNEKYLVVIVGPTAVGKTGLCVELARYFGSDIISTDSRQFYKEMNIGTAKPTETEMKGVMHHFVDWLSVTEEMSAGKFEVEALNRIEMLFIKHDVLLLTGGSGLYVQAVTEGFSKMPEIPLHIRDKLMDELYTYGLKPLLEELQATDPAYYKIVDKNNPQRVVRALEVVRGTGQTFTYYRQKTKQKTTRPFNIIKIGLERERDTLYERINNRMDKMLEDSLLEEARNLYHLRHNNALQTVGYTEIFDFLEGKYDWSEAVRLLKRNSRRYAKRQITWFKRDPQINWFHPDEPQHIIKFIEKKL